VDEGIACKPHYKKEKTFKLKLYSNRNEATVVHRDLAMNPEEAFSLMSEQIQVDQRIKSLYIY